MAGARLVPATHVQGFFQEEPASSPIANQARARIPWAKAVSPTLRSHFSLATSYSPYERRDKGPERHGAGGAASRLIIHKTFLLRIAKGHLIDLGQSGDA